MGLGFDKQNQKFLEKFFLSSPAIPSFHDSTQGPCLCKLRELRWRSKEQE